MATSVTFGSSSDYNNWTSTIAGVSCGAYGKVTVAGRTANTVTLNCEARFAFTGNGSTEGYENYYVTFEVSGTSVTKTTNNMLMADHPWWYGAGWKTNILTSSFNVNVSSYSDLPLTIKCYFWSTDGPSYSSTKTGTVNSGAYSIVPTAPTLTATTDISQVSNYFYIGYNRDTTINLTCSGGDNIYQRDYQVSRNGGAYSSISGGYISDTSYAYTLPQDFVVGDTLEFKVVVNSSTGDTATSSATSTMTAKYRTPDSVTITSPSSATVIPCIDQPSVTWASVPQNISYYRVQYTPPSGTAVSTTVPSSTLTYTLPVSITLDPGNSIRFTITPVNPTTSGTGVTSATITAGGGLYVKYNGAYKLGAPYTKVGGAWKRGCAYIKKNGVWKLTE